MATLSAHVAACGTAWLPASTPGIMEPMSDHSDDDWDSLGDDEGDDETSQLVGCPSCQEPIFEDAEQCPYCGDYIVHSTSALAGRPLWFCALGLLGVAAAIYCLVQ